MSDETIRFGTDEKDYQAKQSYKGYKIRRDSAVKLLHAVSGEAFYARTSDYDGMNGCVYPTDSKYSHSPANGKFDVLDEDAIERIADEIERYDSYHVSVYPEEGRMEIWSNALGKWEVVTDEWGTQEGGA